MTFLNQFVSCELLWKICNGLNFQKLLGTKRWPSKKWCEHISRVPSKNYPYVFKYSLAWSCSCETRVQICCNEDTLNINLEKRSITCKRRSPLLMFWGDDSYIQLLTVCLCNLIKLLLWLNIKLNSFQWTRPEKMCWPRWQHCWYVWLNVIVHSLFIIELSNAYTPYSTQ